MAELGEPEVVVLEGEDFDAFNDDTFGDGNEVWDEEEHEKQMAQMTMMARGDFEPRIEAGQDFFDLKDGSDLIGDSLEPEGLETVADDAMELEEEAVDYGGISDSESQEVADLLKASQSNGRGGAIAAAAAAHPPMLTEADLLAEQLSRQHVQQPARPTTADIDPAILNVVREPSLPGMLPSGWPPGAGLPSGMMPPPGHARFPPMPPGMNPQMMGLLDPMRPPMRPPQPSNHEFQDPAIMAMQPPVMRPPGPAGLPPNLPSGLRLGRPPGLPPNLPPNMMGMMPPTNLPGKSLQEIEREMLQSPNHRPAHNQHHLPQPPPQQQQPQHYHQQPMHQHFHQNQNQPRRQHYQNNYRNNFQNNRGDRNRNWNHCDEKNNETFGEDFVADHQFRQQRPAQRYFYGERERFGGLITPGHVHVLGILRGTRTRDEEVGKTQPTGNPMLDMVREREQDLRHGGHHQNRYDETDEYAGLMTQRERQWIINIQLNQLKCENPFLDDYYYTVFKQKQELEALELAKKKKQEFSKQHRELQRQLSISEEAKDSSRQLRRDEEGAQLLLPAETSGADKDGDYTPKQFTNSLGKLQAITVKAPRKMLDVSVMVNEPETSSSQKDTRNYKLTLLELERMYSLLIDVEDCEKKLMALPTNTAMRTQVELEKEEAKGRLWPNLAVEARLKKYLVVRKGKALMVRALRLLDEGQMKIFCCTLFSMFTTALKRDRDDKLLGLFWNAGISKHLSSLTSTATITQYLQLLKTPSTSTSTRGGSKSPPPNSRGGILKSVLASPLGVSIFGACIHRLGQLPNGNEAKHLVVEIGQELADVKDISNPVEKPEEKIIFKIVPDDQEKNFNNLLEVLNR